MYLRYPDLRLGLQLYDVHQVEERHTWTIVCSVPHYMVKRVGGRIELMPTWVLFHKSLYDYHLVVATVLSDYRPWSRFDSICTILLRLALPWCHLYNYCCKFLLSLLNPINNSSSSWVPEDLVSLAPWLGLVMSWKSETSAPWATSIFSTGSVGSGLLKCEM